MHTGENDKHSLRKILNALKSWITKHVLGKTNAGGKGKDTNLNRGTRNKSAHAYIYNKIIEKF